MGFPSPAQDWVERPLDLNEHLIRHPAATFFMKTPEGDLLIVDRAVDPRPDDLAVAVVDGELAVRRIPKEASDLQVWGVVAWVIHKP